MASPDKCLGFRLGLRDRFTEIVSSTSKPFIGHHQEFFVRVKIFFFK